MIHPSSRSLRVVIAIAVGVHALAVLLVVRSIPALTAATREVYRAQRELRDAVATWERDGFAGAPVAAESLGRARASLQRAAEHAEAQSYLRFVPGARGLLDTVVAATRGGGAWVAGAHELVTSVSDFATIAEQAHDRAYDAFTVGERASLADAIGTALLRVRRAHRAFEEGDALLARARCPFFARAVIPACRSLDRALVPPELQRIRTQLRAVVRAVDAVADLLQRPDPVAVLLLYLNHTELRPGGGFLGTYGLATVQRGSLTSFTTDDIYTLDRSVEGTQRILPPGPFRTYGIVPWWYLRDANWSPDFAVSTATVLDFYRREGGAGDPQIVVGFTPALAADLLTFTGPITVDGVRFDAGNIADELEYQVEQAFFAKGIPPPQRKAIIAPLSRAVVDRMLARPFREWGPVRDALTRAVAERQLMVYASDPALESAFAALDIAGRVRAVAPGDDALLVVDANLGALKTDAVIERSVRYALAPDATGGYRGTITLTYRNTGTFSWKTTRYRTYTRVYLPSGTQLLGAHGAMTRDRSRESGAVDRYEELGRTAFGAFVSVEPGETRTLTLDVHIAPAVADRIRSGTYRLFVQKQLGAPKPTELTVDHEFGKIVGTADPPEVPAAQGNSRYTVESDLLVDREFMVVLTMEEHED